MMKSDSSRDSQSRKYQLTINNPTEKGLDHDEIKTILLALKSTMYFCMADEVGEKEKTPHTHIYVAFSSPVRFSTIRRAFNNTAHIEVCRGTSEQNRAYILKSQGETSTFYEWGNLPNERPGHRSDLVDLYQQIKAGASDAEILEGNPAYLRHIGLMERARQAIAKEASSTEYRDVKVIYIYGPPSSGKTRSVVEKCGDILYRVTDYKNPWDSYTGQRTVCLDNYAGDFPLRNLLTYTEGYKTELPRRYSNTWAQYDTVYIISNVSPNELYKDDHYNHPDLWQAYLRRLNTILRFDNNGRHIRYEVTADFCLEPVDEDPFEEMAPGFGGIKLSGNGRPTDGTDYKKKVVVAYQDNTESDVTDDRGVVYSC